VRTAFHDVDGRVAWNLLSELRERTALASYPAPSGFEAREPASPETHFAPSHSQRCLSIAKSRQLSEADIWRDAVPLDCRTTALTSVRVRWADPHGHDGRAAADALLRRMRLRPDSKESRRSDHVGWPSNQHNESYVRIARMRAVMTNAPMLP